MVKANLVNGPHSAGIFADMTIDGPEIGTLVLIVDRAKNLPNRKTIGKQDPYCAARLGKEAKKTTTDIRGGQTPKWDQELRFTVHDSPDYYQLKLSVFNDDKRTELIGETWIDLRDIIVPGGGQNDDWQTLSCKGKYAGDIRIEITFYDSRPKPERPAAKPKPVESDYPAGQQKVPKRRPLPSDPYTGQAPAQPLQSAPSHVPTPPRPQTNIPREFPPEHSTPEHVQTPPWAAPQSNSPYPTNHTPSHPGQHGTPPSLRNRHPDNYSAGPGSSYHTPLSRADAPRGSLDRERYPVYPDDLAYSPDHQGHTPDKRYTQSAPYGTTSVDSDFRAETEDERPPPPPAHRTTPGGTPEVMYNSNQDNMHQSQTPPTMRKDVLRNEAHRQSVPSNAYPGRPVYRGYDSAPALAPAPSSSGNDPEVSPPRHHPYDAPHESHHRSLQPTVEDVPDSPGSGLVDDYWRSGSRAPPYDEVVYRKDPSPAPLNLSGRNSAPAVQYNAPRGQSVSPDYARSDLSRASASYTSHDPRNTYGPYPTGHELELPVPSARAADSSTRYEMPVVPSSLIPGMDPALSMEISQRIGEDRRHERRHTQPAPQNPPVGSMRGRQMVEPPPSYSAPPPETSQHFNQPRHNYDSYDRSPVPYTGGASQHRPGMMNDISPSHSPSGHNTIKRKSVSPAPPPESRRLSGIPFGPDSYDALNPTIAASKPKESVSPEYDEVNGMIITHDGREVDPSDHLPMDTWAPEPEPKGGKASTETSSRPSLSGPQPPPPSGRKPLRIRERPTSSLPPATYITPETKTSLPPPSTGRNRLQKRGNRNSAMPVMMSGANGPGPGSSPLAPLPQPQDRDNFSLRPLPRASTLDYENHAPPPMYDVPNPGAYAGRDHSSSAPAVPAKIPLASRGGVLMPMGYGHGVGAGGEMTLMEEMSRIDIGTGRARRHGQRPAIGGF